MLRPSLYPATSGQLGGCFRVVLGIVVNIELRIIVNIELRIFLSEI
jgi:hypothetical protein